MPVDLAPRACTPSEPTALSPQLPKVLQVTKLTRLARGAGGDACRGVSALIPLSQEERGPD